MTPRPGGGRLFALASAFGYGSALPLSRLAFDDGTNAVTVAFLRYVALALMLGTWVVAAAPGRAQPLRAREIAASLLLGVAYFGVSIGTLLAASRMSVSLTVLIFYTHPSLILITVALLDRRCPRAADVAVFTAAFAGLGLALDVTAAGADTRGVSLAALAAFAALLSFVVIDRVLRGADAARATALAALAAAAASGCAVWLSDDFALPGTWRGWSLLALVVALFATAVLCMFLAIRAAGPVRASMLLFLEPVVAIGVALALLGERLSPLQWLGALLVIGAVAAAGRSRRVGD